MTKKKISKEDKNLNNKKTWKDLEDLVLNKGKFVFIFVALSNSLQLYFNSMLVTSFGMIFIIIFIILIHYNSRLNSLEEVIYG